VNLALELSPSRRDDLESWFYCLVEFFTGSLPWTQYMKLAKKQQKAAIRHAKETITATELCSQTPPELCQIYRYIRGLSYEQDPDYIYLKSLLHKIVNDEPEFRWYDWQAADRKAAFQSKSASFVSELAGRSCKSTKSQKSSKHRSKK
jgi:hypothetical protein